MRKPVCSLCVFVCMLSCLLCITASSPGAEGILNTDTTGTSLVMADLALRDTISYTPDPSDWTIYFHPGIRFGTDDRVIGFYDVVVPVYLSDTSMLFVNPRFSHDSMDGHEWNLGGGYRHILWNDQLMLGVNAYYDIKKHGDSGKYFDQWGMGLEAMGEFDDVLASVGGLGLTGRFNFYVPLSGSKSGVGTGGAGAGGGYTFSSLGIYTDIGGGGGTVYEPLAGLDYEMGVRIPYLSNYVEIWAYAGGYHYQGRESGHLDGFCGRIEVIPADFLALDFEYRNDNWNGDELYGEVKVEVPFSIGNLVRGENPFEGLGSRFGGSRDLHERMVEPVRRDIDIKIETITRTGGGAITSDGLIEEIIFVSEGAAAGTGNGSYEKPYASIDEALGDGRLGVTAFTIHVINDDQGDMVAGGGDFTTVGGITNLLIWGSGASHPVYGTPVNMTLGFPEIDTILVVDDVNAEVMGLYFNPNAASYGLAATGATGIRVHDNMFTAFTNPALRFDNFDGASVYNNTFGGNGYGMELNGGSVLDVYDNTFAGRSGIAGTGGTNISITGNTFDVENYGIGFFYGSNNIEDLTVTGNSFTVNAPGAAYGVYLEAPGPGTDIGTSGSPVIVSGNTLTATGAGETSGVLFMSGGALYADIVNNDFIGGVESTGGDAFGVRLDARDTITASIGNNDMTGGVTAAGNAWGIAVLSTTGSVFADIINNSLTGGVTGGNDATGIFAQGNLIGTDGLGTVDSVTISGNSMTVTGTGNDAWGVLLNATGGDLFADIMNNNMSGGIDSRGIGGAVGMALRAEDFLDANIMNNIFGDIAGGTTATSVNGLIALMSVTSSIDAVISGNIATGEISGDNYTGAVGLFASTDINTEIMNNTFGGITGGTSAGSYIAGLFLNADTGSIDAVISGNAFTGPFKDGLYTYGMALGSDDYINAEITNNTFAGISTTTDEVYGIALDSDSSSIDAVISDNIFAGLIEGPDAFGLRLEAMTSINADITDNTFAGITGNSHSAFGMNLVSFIGNISADITGNTLNVTSESTIAGNGAIGAYIAALGGLIGDATGTYTLFQNNSGTIDGVVSRYMLFLADSTTPSNSYVDWTGSFFTPLNSGAAAGWSGNAPGAGYGTMENSIDTNNFGGTINPN